MIILEHPYISEFLQQTLSKLNIPVLSNEAVQALNVSDSLSYLNQEEFVQQVRTTKNLALYSNSEHSINWIVNHLGFTDYPQKINIFKDKVKFRDLIKKEYPDFFYQQVSFEELESLDVSRVKMPFILKPSIGFFSMGVYKINHEEDFKQTVAKLQDEVENIKRSYPIEVVDSNTFIIEEYIDGEEFAVDLYFNEQNEPVILNIFKHIFSSEEDVSDRVYITSKEIIEAYHDPFFHFFKKLGEMVELKRFPMHVEFRVDDQGQVVPIEINPMRFAGWCTTDIAYYAYGINVYEYFFEQKKPDWAHILQHKEDKIYSIVVADLPRKVDVAEVSGIDYDKLQSNFEHVLELRKIDYVQHGVFAFLFTETSCHNWAELEGILKSDLMEYLILRSNEVS